MLLRLLRIPERDMPALLLLDVVVVKLLLLPGAVPFSVAIIAGLSRCPVPSFAEGWMRGEGPPEVAPGAGDSFYRATRQPA